MYEFIEGLPRQEQIIVKRLRMLVLECLPLATEKNIYGAPFYTHHRMICFIWPPSFYWTSKKKTLKEKEKGVSFGFCQGDLMSNEDGVLDAGGRKKMYCMYFKSVKEIDEAQVRALLFEAELIDNGFAKPKRKSLKRR